MDSRELINLSLELAAERVDDLSPIFYQRLYGKDAAIAGLFGPDSAIAQGRMLNEVIRSVLDSIDNPDYLEGLIAAEVAKHDAWDVTPPMYVMYFDCLLETLRDLLQEQWSADMETAWRTQFDVILQLVNQYAGS